MDSIAIIDRGRGPELEGTRITVYDVVHYLEKGRSPNYIAAALNLSTAQVLALVRYVEDHKDEVMAIHRQIEDEIARGNPREVDARVAASATHALIQQRWEEIQRRRTQEANGEGHSQ